MTRPTTPASPFSPRLPRGLPLAVLCAALCASPAAQALYKVVGPDGKVSYTDRPPETGGTPSKVTPVAAPGSSPVGSSLASLPLELRQVAMRYPVVLYTVPTECNACNLGRNMLKQRGIPFTERQVLNAEDGKALHALTGGREMPVMVVGTQVNRGYTPEVWRQYLDAAGYPATSRLPANYEFSPPTPLTERKAPPPKPGSAAEPPPAPVPTPGPGATPQGIQF